MKIINKSNKIISFGTAVILPGESNDIPIEYEKNPVIDFYKRSGMITIIGKPTIPKKTDKQIAAEKEAAKKKANEEAESLRKQRLASLKNASEEEVAALANELGINSADCKDAAEVLKRVKAALSK